jgi:Lon protease-like protein
VVQSRVEPNPSRLPEVVPVFPLPNVVLFPGTVVPLHVFEQRYRAMVRDSVERDGIIGIVLLRQGYEKHYAGAPAFHELGTVGRIEQLDPLPDGRFNLNVVGLQRVEFHEVPSTRLYRQAKIAPRPEPVVDDSDPEIQRAKLELLASHAMLQSELRGDDEGTLVVDDRLSFALAVNGACANLPVASEIRQQLLSLDCLIERQRRVSRLVASVAQSLLKMRSSGRDQTELPS